MRWRFPLYPFDVYCKCTQLTNGVTVCSKEILTSISLLVVLGPLIQGSVVFGLGRTVLAYGMIIHVSPLKIVIVSGDGIDVGFRILLPRTHTQCLCAVPPLASHAASPRDGTKPRQEE